MPVGKRKSTCMLLFASRDQNSAGQQMPGGILLACQLQPVPKRRKDKSQCLRACKIQVK